MAPPPVVTGLSPKEGPPGTRVTIRGEFLGNQPNDLIGLTICGCDCLLSAEWKSVNKIIARSGPGKGRGDIIVTTRSGGRGTSTVEFRGYHETIGPMKESAVWVEENLLWSRRSMSPSSYQQEDPLGLSVEENDKKFPEEELHEYFPDGSGDLTSENFTPGWFLLENHHATTFNDLKAGLAFLRRKVDGQKEGQLSFLKKNVGPVMDQVDTLLVLKDKIEQDIQEFGIDPTTKLEKAIREAMEEANKLFEDVLSRRDRADSTRSALALLTRFRFLFTLPTSIEHNIKKGDYDLVINDYARVKNLFGKTDVVVFKKVLAEVEHRIEKFQDMLHARLQQMPISIDEQKRLIRCLVNLETVGDPAWDAVASNAKHVTEQLNKCREEHRNAEVESVSKKSAQKHKNRQTNPDYQNSVPQRILLIEEITEIVTENLPNLWKMGQSYFMGDLYITPNFTRQTTFKHMILSVIETFCKYVREAVLPHTIDKKSLTATSSSSPSQPTTSLAWPVLELDSITEWLPHCLRYVRSSYTMLIKLDLPGEALDIVATLVQDLRMHTLSSLFKQATDKIKLLHKQETWRIEYEGNYGGITDLPFKFEKIIQEVMQLVKESVLISEQRENSLLQNPTSQREFNHLIQVMLCGISGTFEKLAFTNDSANDEDHTSAVSQLIGSPAVNRVEKVNYSTPIFEHRLLTTLANCQFTTKIVLPRLQDLFHKQGYPTPVIAIETAKSTLNTLDKSIMEAYLEQKCDPLVGTIEPSMYIGRFEWDTRNMTNDVSPYVKECLSNLISVQTEVYSISPTLVDKLLKQIVETVAEEISRLMSCVKKFSDQGNIQARVDILTLQDILSPYCTLTAKNFFKEALGVLPKIAPENQKIIDTTLQTSKKRMNLQIQCFHGVVSTQSNGIVL
ncbi:exocyst complex component 2 [Chrysoperla carnea]|uniref:exocyst complex component 2 n=1 Tax=Chrysoperla carnea TaxID=189513 RepID=UPI001D069057|nr:exocyst complex component 2 [Chrysoperla carnea]